MIIEIKIEKHFQIERTTIAFSKNLNLIIGESGSGKSLLVEAIAFLMGNELTKETKRQGELDIEGTILIDGKNVKIRRNYKIGSSLCYIDKKVVEMSEYRALLKKIARYYDQYFMINNGITNEYIFSLMKVEGHISYSEYTKNFSSYSRIYQKYKEYKHELEKLEADKDMEKINKELAKYDLEEIKRITDECEPVGNIIEKMNKYTQIYDDLKGNEDALLKIRNNLNKVNLCEMANSIEMYNSFMIEYQDNLDQVKMQKKDLSYKLENFSNYNDMISVKNKLCRIYNCNLDELIDKKNLYISKLGKIDELKIDLRNVEEGLKEIIFALDESNDILNEHVKNVSLSVLDEVAKLLIELGFKCNFAKLMTKRKRTNNYKRTMDGNYAYEIIIEDESKSKTVNHLSGGETSRLIIALSLQTVKQQLGGVLIYDEIDTGISGEFSVKVGREFSNASINNQLIAISHNPQVCAKADLLIRVSKCSSNTLSKVEEIGKNSIEVEIAKMILGNIYDKNGIEVAKQLINK